MQDIEYIVYLTFDEAERIRVFARKEKKDILEFVVQYESLLDQVWKPIIRYDTAHGFAHKDIIKADGTQIKQPLFFDNYNLAFTFAAIDIKSNWKKYRRNFIGDEKDD